MNGVQLLVGGLLLGALVVTVVGYPRRYGALSGRSRLFRTAGMGLIDLLLALALIWVSSTFEGRAGAIRYLALFASCILLGFSLAFLALLDALEALVLYRRERRTALHESLQPVPDSPKDGAA